MNDADWRCRALRLLAGVFLFRFVYLFLFCAEYDLAGDEAYYWDWGRRPDWGYYSKPPMIGWLMGLVGWLSGNAEWAIRLAPLALGTLSLLLLHRLTLAMFGARAGFFVLPAVVLTPGNAALNLLFTIDAPLVLAWTAALLAFWHALQRPTAWGCWCLLAVALGFGALSKQMMLLFPVLMILTAAVCPGYRATLRAPGFWSAILLGLLFLVPNLLWQQANGWPTVTHMQEHFAVGNPAEEKPPGFWQHVWWFVQFPLTQAGLYSPITWLALMALLIVAVRGWRVLGDAERLLVMFSAPGLLVFHLLSMRQDVHPNWPAVYLIPAFVLLAGWMARVSLQDALDEKWHRRARMGLKLGASLTLILYFYLLMVGPLRLAGHKAVDAFPVTLRAWKEAGEKAGEFLKQVPRPEQTFIVVLGHRHHASEMAFYMPGRPRVYRWQWDGRRMSQYEIWPAPGDDMKGWDALVLYPDSEDKEKKMTPSFFFRRGFKREEGDAEKMGEISVPIGHGKSRGYGVFLFKEMSGWPASVPEQVAADPRLQELVESKQKAPKS